jgi:hypothetical protein
VLQRKDLILDQSISLLATIVYHHLLGWFKDLDVQAELEREKLLFSFKEEKKKRNSKMHRIKAKPLWVGSKMNLKELKD